VRDLVTTEGPAISFPVGYHELHPDVSVNFQMNRFYGWVGDGRMLTEMREAAAGVHDYPTLTTIFLEVGDKALARHETLKGAYYLRLERYPNRGNRLGRPAHLRKIAERTIADDTN
jgi:hypothetical protein